MAGRRGAELLRLRAGVGRARAGARRRQGRGFFRDDCAAGSASHRGAPKPDRAYPQCGSGGVLRLGARSRLAAVAAYAVGQRPYSAWLARLSRGIAVRSQARDPESHRPRARRYSSFREPAHPSRPAQYRESRGSSRGAVGRARSRQRRAVQDAGGFFLETLAVGHRRLGQARRSAQECSGRCVP